jgi:hypothetical protein
MQREKNAPLAIKGSTFDAKTPTEFGYPNVQIVPDPMSKTMPIRNATRHAAFTRNALTSSSSSSNSQRLWQRKSAVPPTAAQELTSSRRSGRTEALALVETLRSGDDQDADVARHRELAMRMSQRHPQLGAAGGATMSRSFGSDYNFGTNTRGSASRIVHPDAQPWKQAPPEIYAILKQLAMAAGETGHGMMPEDDDLRLQPEVDSSAGSARNRSLRGKALSSLEAAFRASDKDRSGLLSREELRDALRRLDISINPSQLRRVIE